MKTIATLTIVALLFTSIKADDEMIQKMLEHSEECAKQTDVSRDVLEKLVKSGEFTDDKNFKCFIKCLYTKSGVMSDNGDFDIEKLEKTLDDDKNADLINKCKGLKGSDHCDTAFLVAKCLEEK